MLYVFIVSSGSMLKFDMNLAVKKVTELKAEIERSKFQIPMEEQVLLCSGGEELQDENMVGNYYGAGTDTNPIFLFRKFTNDCEYSYNVPLHTSIDLSIEDDVRGCANMAPNTSTVAVRATLAQRIADAAARGRRECDELVHAQHLQQQGWAAVIANLEDGKETLLKRKTHCEEHYLKYLAKRFHYQEVIKIFPDDIEILAKIPLSPKLMHGSEYFTEELETDRTLLSWVCTEPRSFLDALVEKCQRSLEELNENCLSALNEDVSSVLKNADNPDIKEVKGIEERLSLLNKQIEEAKKLEKDQRDLASWFNVTQSRMNMDPMVLPDLCGTFQKQLELMLENHKCLRDILERCTRAKLELSESISYRIKYISRVESDMYGLQLRIKFLEKYVQSVCMQIESFEQVHSAPKRYIQLLAETCRRKVFSSSYMKWASELSSQTSKLYEKEISIRKTFDGEESRNIVDNLFPGMEDVPPPFAIECPSPFDQNLPNIVREDLDVLKIQFPEFAHFCEVLPPDPMPYISQAETDSAFSSNIPSSRLAGDSADSGGKTQPEKGQSSPHKLAAPSGDYSSLPSEYASMPNEVFSLTSSPFEDPLLPNQLDLSSKRTKAQNSEVSSTSVGGKTSSPLREVESDGEEFETVDPCGPTVVIRPHTSDRKRSASAPRPNSTSEVITINKSSSDKCPKLSKARSDGDAISPIQERLKSSESLLVSTDFQSTEYYIDDSMPSSYTESNATSPLLRGGNRMVKSHHVVVAELQKQVDDKNSLLVGAMRFIQEMQGGLRSDLCNLRESVKEELWEKMSEVSQVMETIHKTMEEIQRQTLAEKEEAISKAKSETEKLDMSYGKRLEIEHQKLSDAESQIANYEEYIQQILANFEETKMERDTLESELCSKKEIIQSMMLEHELELDSVRNQKTQDMELRDDKILELSKILKEKESEIQTLEQQRDLLNEDMQNQMKQKEFISALLEQKETDLSERLKDLKQLQEEVKQFQEAKDSSKAEEKVLSLQLELEKEKEEFSEKLKEMESCRAKELKELEENLMAKHRSEMESLRSRYKLAVSTTMTTMEKSIVGSPENLENETAFGPESLQKILAENHEKWEAEKEECIKSVLAEQEQKLNEAVAAAVREESVKQHKEKMQIVASMRREREDSIEKTKARLMAELQVSFNEAINSVTKEKDAIIEGLRSKVAALEANLLSIKSEIDRCSSVYLSEALLSQSDSGASSSHKVLHRDEERLIQKLKAQIEPFLHVSDQKEVPGPSPDESEFLKKGKLPSHSKIGPCIDCTYKISILTCDVGDLILLCYEEKYDSFVAFHLGQFIHFLHSDSLQPLGLKIPGPTEKWALGVITNKEFCVARKPSNRYKMNVGTKFYRLKVKPWDRDKAIEDFHIHRTSQSTVACSSSSRTLSAQSSTTSEETSQGAKGMSTSSI